jgi:hypothetical protein
VNSIGAPAGDYPIRIIAKSANSADTALYDFANLTISETPALKVTGIDPDNAYLTQFMDTVTISGAGFQGPAPR